MRHWRLKGQMVVCSIPRETLVLRITTHLAVDYRIPRPLTDLLAIPPSDAREYITCTACTIR